MARKPNAPTAAKAPAQLLIPVNDARERLISRRDLGVSLHNNQSATIVNPESYEQARQAYVKWNSYNQELLRRIFDGPEYADSYSMTGVSMVMSLGEKSLSSRVKDHLDTFQRKLEFIDNLAERIDLIEVSQEAGREAASHEKMSPAQVDASTASDTAVFVVHGQDNETKAIVARFIEHCGLTPVILHEQIDQGRTIIEKFEQTADVRFAVVLLTPDDVGALRTTATPDGLKPRARQNVILELGYFIGRLGRSRVCALKKGEVELPSDISGVIYTPYDGADEGWKIKLAREMRAAGLKVDLNKALS